MIDSIRFRNFKGQTAVQPLTGRDIFIGRNGTGKTTRVQALGLSFLGYVPGNGRTEAETFKLATGNEMSVGLHTSDGFSFERTFTRSEEHNRKSGERTIKISQGILVSPGRGEANDTQRKSRIVEEAGNLPVMLNFGEFMELSDTKRRDFIYGLSPITSESWSKERVRAYLASALLTDELAENNPEQFETMEGLIDEAMAQFPDGFGVSEGLQAMLDWTTAQLKFWNSKRKDAQGAVRQLADLKNSLAETDRNIMTERGELDEQQKKIVEVEKQLAKDTERKRAIDTRSARINELKAAIEALGTPAEGPDAVSALDERIASLRAQLQEVKPAPIAEHEKRIHEIKVDKESFYVIRDRLRESLIQMQAGVATLEESLKTIDVLNGVCVIDKRIACEKDFSRYRIWVEQKKADADSECTLVDARVQEIVANLSRLDEEERQIWEVMRQEAEAERAVTTQNRLLNEQINALERDRLSAISARERRADQVALHRTELERLMNEPVDAIAPLDLLEKQAEAIRSRMAALLSSVDEKTRARQTIMLMQQSSLDNRASELKAACLKSLNEALGPKGVQGELVKEILAPLLEEIRNNLRCMGFDYEPFFETESETGKEVFQFGWINERRHRINFDALSTGQQTVFLAAMMLTIIDRANPKLKVLVLDNLNHLDSQNLQLVIDGLAVISDRLDNVILAGAVESSFVAPGWNVIRLGEEAEALEQSA